MRRLLTAMLLLAATQAHAVRHTLETAAAREAKLTEGLAAIDVNLARFRQAKADAPTPQVAQSYDGFIVGLESARSTLQKEHDALKPVLDALQKEAERKADEPEAGDFTPLEPEPEGSGAAPPPQTPAAPGNRPAPPPVVVPDIPETPLPGEKGAPVTSAGLPAPGGAMANSEPPAEEGPAAEAGMARAAAAAEGRAGVIGARAAALGAGLGQDMRAPESLGAGAGAPGGHPGAAAGLTPGSPAAPGGAASPAGGAAPGTPGAPGSGSGLGGALEAMGLSVGRDPAGRPAILRRDGSPATARELALVRADSSGTLPYASHQELLAIHASRSDLRSTDLKHVDKPPQEKDLRWSRSCDKVSGECNKHARKTYKRGEHVPPEDLADIWKAIKASAGLGGGAPRRPYDGSSHFRRMRAMLAGGGGEDGAAGDAPHGGVAPPPPGEGGVEGSAQPGGGYSGRTGGAGAAAPGDEVRDGFETPRRSRPLWPALLITATLGGGLLWKFRSPR